MVRKTTGGGNGTQRTFRNVKDFSYGPDGYIYFSDHVGENKYQIHSINAKAGSIMRQLTSNSEDNNPIMSENKKYLFFTRYDNSGPVIWCLNVDTGTLTSCARGYNPYPVGDGENVYFISSRANKDKSFNVWKMNFNL